MTRRMGVAGGILVILAIGLASWSLVRTEHRSDAWPIGTLADYPPDAPVALRVDHAYFDRFLPEGHGASEAVGAHSVSPTSVWVINRNGTDPIVLLQRSPWLGCRVQLATLADAVAFGAKPPDGFEVGFLDPCHGGLFSIDGDHLDGPGTASLSRFPVRIDSDGTLLVDLTDLKAG